MKPDCLKGRVVCGTVYGDLHLQDLLGSIVRVGYRIPAGCLSSATWPLQLKKHYNGLINQSNCLWKFCTMFALMMHYFFIFLICSNTVPRNRSPFQEVRFISSPGTRLSKHLESVIMVTTNYYKHSLQMFWETGARCLLTCLLWLFIIDLKMSWILLIDHNLTKNFDEKMWVFFCNNLLKVSAIARIPSKFIFIGYAFYFYIN